MKLLSICTAAYNAEQYICQMIDSILASSLSEYVEIIIVDDGSTDNTKKIIYEYEKKFSNIVRVEHQQNNGSGAARNKAFELATGKYIKIIDADDYVNTENFTKYLNVLINSDADMVINDLYICKNNQLSQYSFCKLEKRFYNIVDLKCEPFLLSMHGITYKTSVIANNKIKLSEGVSYVDKEYITLPLPYIRTIQYVDFPFYVYRLGVNGQSVDPKISLQKNEMRRIVGNRLLNAYKQAKNTMNDSMRKLMWYNIALLFADYYKIYCSEYSVKYAFKIFKCDMKIRQSDRSLYNYIGKKIKNLKDIRKRCYLYS